MRKTIALYIKHQSTYLIFLMALFVLPLGLFLQFSTYKLPKVQYVILATLFVSQYVFYREKVFRRKIENDVARILKNEFARIPSRKEIHARSSLVIQYRGFSIIVSALSILALMVYFKEF
ncbi:MAG: hypothetical protein K9K67_11640 [Bacteriovoracaceae bacterium]|nr:hypothetical protein [Bacteriovoracaceae bacterium]